MSGEFGATSCIQKPKRIRRGKEDELRDEAVEKYDDFDDHRIYYLTRTCLNRCLIIKVHPINRDLDDLMYFQNGCSH